MGKIFCKDAKSGLFALDTNSWSKHKCYSIKQQLTFFADNWMSSVADN